MKKSELRQLIREQIKQANLKEEGVLGFDNEAEFMQVLLDYVKSTGKVDELFQMLKAQGMSEEDIMQILNDNNLTLEEEVNEVEPQTNLIGIAAHTLKNMNAEEAIDAIDRLMLYLKDAKADIEYKSY